MYVVEKRPLGHVLTVRDEIDVASAPHFSAELVKTALESGGALVVDLSECRFVDSSGLHAFIKAGRTIGRRFRIVVGESNYLRRLFDATGLSKALEVDETVDEALSAGYSASQKN